MPRITIAPRRQHTDAGPPVTAVSPGAGAHRGPPGASRHGDPGSPRRTPAPAGPNARPGDDPSRARAHSSVTCNPQPAAPGSGCAAGSQSRGRARARRRLARPHAPGAVAMTFGGSQPSPSLWFPGVGLFYAEHGPGSQGPPAPTSRPAAPSARQVQLKGRAKAARDPQARRLRPLPLAAQLPRPPQTRRRAHREGPGSAQQLHGPKSP